MGFLLGCFFAYAAKPHLLSRATDMRLGTVLIKRSSSPFGSITVRCPSRLLAIALIFFCSLSVLHAQETAELGDIQGIVIDSKLEKPLISHPVVLTVHKADTVETQEKTTTDENGNYRFTELPLDPSVHYTVSTVHEGTDYTEKDLVLSTWVPSLKIDFDIGAFSDDKAHIYVRTHSFIIGPPPADHPPDGAVTVAEAIGIENLSTLPFRTTHGTQKVGINFTLPTGVEGLQPHSPNLTLAPNTHQILLKTPLPPGESHLGYEYIFHIEKDRLDLSRRLNFNTDQFFIFVPEGIGFVPRSKFFGPPRREQIHNNVYLIYESDKGETFAAGKNIDLALNIDMGPARGALPKQTSNLGQLILIAVAAALTGGFFVAALFKLRAANNTTEPDTDDRSTPLDAGWLLKLGPDDREHVRVARLEFITHLDDKYERQEISERVYKRLRREQTERLTTLLDQQKRGNNA